MFDINVDQTFELNLLLGAINYFLRKGNEGGCVFNAEGQIVAIEDIPHVVDLDLVDR